MDQTKRRNPILSFLLSIVLPGLGHVYNGHLREGILFFFGWLVLTVLIGLSGLIFSLSGLICWIATGIGGYILIAILAAIEAARMKETALKRYNKWYVYCCIVLLANIGFAPVIIKIQDDFLGVKTFKMTASSMRPALEKEDYLVAKLEKFGDRVPRRGDIIIFPYPEDRSKDYIKRVIGLPGERIEIKDKMVFVNGQSLRDPWGIRVSNVILPSDVSTRDNFGPVDIPEGAVFVLGDNRDFSHDSRFWGYVETKDIEGKAGFIYWSNDLNRIGKQLH